LVSGATTKRCPAPLSQDPATRRYAYGLEVGPARPHLARPDNLFDDLKRRRVKFRSLTEAIDTETPTGRAMWWMIGVLAELERSLISERTRADVKAAQRRGVKFGRKPKLTPQQIDYARELLGRKNPPSREEVAALFKVDRTTLYRALAVA
jgi:DNA invertase Pin-like site-specific DNA recombinase